jgi:uncharacterized protein YbaR (Trm112 family)
MDKKQLEMMVCPQCNGKLDYEKQNSELVCEKCQLAYPVNDGIPVMLVEEARKLENKA